MCEGADKIGPPSTSKDDPRITNIGKFLRKYKLDELPQLFNVLKFDMALVGPRPTLPCVIETLTQKEKSIILSVRPGITDPASLWNCNEEERLAGSFDPHKKFMEEIYPEIKRLQIEYIKKRNFLKDIIILTKTMWRIVTKK